MKRMLGIMISLILLVSFASVASSCERAVSNRNITLSELSGTWSGTWFGDKPWLHGPLKLFLVSTAENKFWGVFELEGPADSKVRFVTRPILEDGYLTFYTGNLSICLAVYGNPTDPMVAMRGEYYVYENAKPVRSGFYELPTVIDYSIPQYIRSLIDSN